MLLYRKSSICRSWATSHYLILNTYTRQIRQFGLYAMIWYCLKCLGMSCLTTNQEVGSFIGSVSNQLPFCRYFGYHRAALMVLEAHVWAFESNHLAPFIFSQRKQIPQNGSWDLNDGAQLTVPLQCIWLKKRGRSILWLKMDVYYEDLQLGRPLLASFILSREVFLTAIGIWDAILALRFTYFFLEELYLNLNDCWQDLHYL